MNYLFKISQPHQPVQQQPPVHNLTAVKLTPTEIKINDALAAALKTITTTSNTNIKKLNSLVTVAATSASKAKVSEKNAALTAKSLAKMITTINDLVKQMDTSNADISDLQTVVSNMRTISDNHSGELLLIKDSIDELFLFFFHKAPLDVDISDEFKPVDPTTLLPIPSYILDSSTYVP